MQKSERPAPWQLSGMSYSHLYAQFAYHFGIKRGDINSPMDNLAGVRLARSLVFGKDSELQELYDAIAKWIAAPSNENLVEVADGIADSIYVLLQLSHALDIPIDQIFQAVHDNNMTKISTDGTIKRREDGKILKPDDYKPVDLWPVLYQHSCLRAREVKAAGAENWPVEVD